MCAGCTLNHDLNNPPILDKAREYFASHDSKLQCNHVQHPHGWRQRARLAVRGQAGSVTIGLFRAGSHDVVAIPNCCVHDVLINRAVERLRTTVNTLGIQPYDEATHTGQLRYLQLTVVDTYRKRATTTNAVQAVVVWNRDPSLPTDPELQLLARAVAADSKDNTLCALWVNYQPVANNVIMGPVSALLWGARDVWRVFGGAKVFLGPASFVQANMRAMDAALAAMQRWVTPEATVVDLHAGVGTIGTCGVDQLLSYVCASHFFFTRSYSVGTGIKWQHSRGAVCGGQSRCTCLL